MLDALRYDVGFPPPQGIAALFRGGDGSAGVRLESHSQGRIPFALDADIISGDPLQEVSTNDPRAYPVAEQAQWTVTVIGAGGGAAYNITVLGDSSGILVSDDEAFIQGVVDALAGPGTFVVSGSGVGFTLTSVSYSRYNDSDFTVTDTGDLNGGTLDRVFNNSGRPSGFIRPFGSKILWYVQDTPYPVLEFIQIGTSYGDQTAGNAWRESQLHGSDGIRTLGVANSQGLEGISCTVQQDGSQTTTDTNGTVFNSATNGGGLVTIFGTITIGVDVGAPALPISIGFEEVSFFYPSGFALSQPGFDAPCGLWSGVMDSSPVAGIIKYIDGDTILCDFNGVPVLNELLEGDVISFQLTSLISN
jgi:hypothetical protein